MQVIHEIISDFEKNTNLISLKLEVVDDSTFFLKPYPNKWSIAEILEHLIISEKGACIAMLKSVEIPSRNWNDKLPQMRAFFSSQEIKREAPAQAVPTQIRNNRIEICNQLFEIREKCKKILLDKPYLIATALIHPVMGELSNAEWIYFMSWHGKHHLLQIENIINLNQP